MTAWRLASTPSKYRNERTEIAGILFDSKAEARRYEELCQLEQSGAITNLELQPRFVLQEAFKDAKRHKHQAIVYVADFAYDEPGKPARVVEDVKGVQTAVFKLKLKLFLCLYQEYDFRIITAGRERKPKKRGKR